jgi:hypothetical protein
MTSASKAASNARCSFSEAEMPADRNSSMNEKNIGWFLYKVTDYACE